MRLNKFIALSTGLSRRAADRIIADGNVMINDKIATLGDNVKDTDRVKLNSKPLTIKNQVTIMLNKPTGYVCSRNGQGSKTIYDLIPEDLHHLKPIGRLDKDSSGLLLLTNDGDLANRLTHPSFHKMKVYELQLDTPLSTQAWEDIVQNGVKLDDGLSKFELNWLEKNDGIKWQATLYEGRNRQIRRTFASLGYKVIKLRRTRFGDYFLGDLEDKKYIKI